MKRRPFFAVFLCTLAVLLTACKKEEPVIEKIYVTEENVDRYLVHLGGYNDISFDIKKSEATDATVAKYAEIYYEKLAKATDGMVDEDGNVMPMSDEAIAMFSTDVYTNVKEFLLFVKRNLPDFFEASYEEEIFEKVIGRAIVNSEFNEFPEGLILSKESEVTEKYGELAAGYDVTVEKYLKLLGTSMEAECIKAVKENLVILKIADNEDVAIIDDKPLREAVKDYIISAVK